MVYIVASTYQRAQTYAREEALAPSDYKVLGSMRACYGIRIYWEDELVILDCALERKDWSELRAALWPCT
jgi:hypothetical protein